MFREIKRQLRKRLLGYDVSTYYFSQAGEDHILASLLSTELNSGKGFYVDVGAHHPYHHSNTYLFYRSGWSGINIEPRPGSKQLFDKIRPRDVNLEIGIGNTPGKADYYTVQGSGLMNTFRLQNLAVLGQKDNVESTQQISVHRLEDILQQHVPANFKIDFMTIDVEGMDLEVLQSNNWKIYRPTVVAVETEGNTFEETCNSPESQFLISHGYQPVAQTYVTHSVSTVIFLENQNN